MQRLARRRGTAPSPRRRCRPSRRARCTWPMDAAAAGTSSKDRNRRRHWRPKASAQHPVHRRRGHRRGGLLQLGQRGAVRTGHLLGEGRLEDAHRLAELHRAALELAEHPEHLLGGARAGSRRRPGLGRAARRRACRRPARCARRSPRGSDASLAVRVTARRGRSVTGSLSPSPGAAAPWMRGVRLAGRPPGQPEHVRACRGPGPPGAAVAVAASSSRGPAQVVAGAGAVARRATAAAAASRGTAAARTSQAVRAAGRRPAVRGAASCAGPRASPGRGRHGGRSRQRRHGDRCRGTSGPTVGRPLVRGDRQVRHAAASRRPGVVGSTTASRQSTTRSRLALQSVGGPGDRRVDGGSELVARRTPGAAPSGRRPRADRPRRR